MIYIRKLFMSSLVVMLLLGVTTSLALAQDPVNGQLLWEEELNCANCHGLAGEGVYGKTLAGGEHGDDDEGKHTVEEWITQIRTPEEKMPSYSAEQVSDAMIADIHAYLTALAAPETPGYMKIEVAEDAHAGHKLIVEKKCVACHTETGPIRGFIKRNETPTTELVMTQVRTPRELMPTFSAEQISDDEIALIAAYLAEQVAAEQSSAATTEESSEATTEESSEATAEESSEAAAEESSEAAAEQPPEALPVSGATSETPLVLLIIGAGLLGIGFAARKSRPTTAA